MNKQDLSSIKSVSLSNGEQYFFVDNNGEMIKNLKFQLVDDQLIVIKDGEPILALSNFKDAKFYVDEQTILSASDLGLENSFILKTNSSVLAEEIIVNDGSSLGFTPLWLGAGLIGAAALAFGKSGGSSGGSYQAKTEEKTVEPKPIEPNPAEPKPLPVEPEPNHPKIKLHSISSDNIISDKSEIENSVVVDFEVTNLKGITLTENDHYYFKFIDKATNELVSERSVDHLIENGLDGARTDKFTISGVNLSGGELEARLYWNKVRAEHSDELDEFEKDPTKTVLLSTDSLKYEIVKFPVEEPTVTISDIATDNVVNSDEKKGEFAVNVKFKQLSHNHDFIIKLLDKSKQGEEIELARITNKDKITYNQDGSFDYRFMVNGKNVNYENMTVDVFVRTKYGSEGDFKSLDSHEYKIKTDVLTPDVHVVTSNIPEENQKFKLSYSLGPFTENLKFIKIEALQNDKVIALKEFTGGSEEYKAQIANLPEGHVYSLELPFVSGVNIDKNMPIKAKITLIDQYDNELVLHNTKDIQPMGVLPSNNSDGSVDSNNTTTSDNSETASAASNDATSENGSTNNESPAKPAIETGVRILSISDDNIITQSEKQLPIPVEVSVFGLKANTAYKVELFDQTGNVKLAESLVNNDGVTKINVDFASLSDKSSVKAKLFEVQGDNLSFVKEDELSTTGMINDQITKPEAFIRNMEIIDTENGKALVTSVTIDKLDRDSDFIIGLVNKFEVGHSPDQSEYPLTAISSTGDGLHFNDHNALEYDFVVPLANVMTGRISVNAAIQDKYENVASFKSLITSSVLKDNHFATGHSEEKEIFIFLENGLNSHIRDFGSDDKIGITNKFLSNKNLSGLTLDNLLIDKQEDSYLLKYHPTDGDDVVLTTIQLDNSLSSLSTQDISNFVSIM